MPDKEGVVDIIIPNWNGLKWLPGCLDSIKKQTWPGYRITVVDNGSLDGSVEWISREHPEVFLVALDSNYGFSVAVNRGIDATKNPLIFLLNNDTELAPDCLEQLVAAAKEKHDYAFFATKMLDFYQRDILDGAGDGFLRGGAGYRLGTMEKDGPAYNKDGPVFGACAGAALYRRDLFERIGMFDEDFFAYLEDVDLNVRAASAGLHSWYVPTARVYHIGSASSGSKINKLTVSLSTRNSLMVMFKNYPMPFFFRFLLPITLYQIAWLLFTIKKGCFFAWCVGVEQFAMQGLRVLQKRRKAMGPGKNNYKRLAICFIRAEQEVLHSIMRRRAAMDRGNLLFNLYSRVFL